jgi:hypothetical protein
MNVIASLIAVVLGLGIVGAMWSNSFGLSEQGLVVGTGVGVLLLVAPFLLVKGRLSDTWKSIKY